MDCEQTSDTLACGGVTRERVRYFTGRHLTAADFRMEQNYQRSHRYLHNRLLHGWGVACGLWVVEHPNEACRKDHVAIKSGIAIDCCGHEIIVCSALASPKVPWADRPKAAPADPYGNGPRGIAGAPPDPGINPRQGPYDPAPDTPDEPVLLLCLTFREKPTEKVPVIFDGGACSDPRSEYSRYEDSF